VPEGKKGKKIKTAVTTETAKKSVGRRRQEGTAKGREENAATDDKIGDQKKEKTRGHPKLQ